MASRIRLAYSARWLYQRCQCVSKVLKNGRTQGEIGQDGVSPLGALRRAVLGLALVEVAHSLPANGTPGIISPAHRRYRSEQSSATALVTEPEEASPGPKTEPIPEKDTPKDTGAGRVSAWLSRKIGKHSPTAIHAEDEALLHQVDHLCEEEDFETAFDILESTRGDSAEHLWRRSRLLYELGKKHPDRKEREKLIRTGYECLLQAVELDEHNYHAHYWMSPIVHAQAELEGLVATANVAKIMQKHLEALVRIRPNDPQSYFCYGMWYFALAEVSWFERFAASAIGSELPNCTFTQARDAFLKAEQIAPRSSLLVASMLGKSYLRLHDLENAQFYLRQAVSMCAKKAPDIKAQEESIQLLKKVEKSFKST